MKREKSVMEVGKYWQEYLHQKVTGTETSAGIDQSWKRGWITVCTWETQMLSQSFLSWQLRPPPRLDRAGDFQLKNQMVCGKKILGCQLSIWWWRAEKGGLWMYLQSCSQDRKRKHMGILWVTLLRKRNRLTKLGIVRVRFYFWFWHHIPEDLGLWFQSHSTKPISFPCSLSPWLNDWWQGAPCQVAGEQEHQQDSWEDCSADNCRQSRTKKFM